MRIALLVCLLSVTALVGAFSAGAEEDSGDYVVLSSGERLDCEIVRADADVVEVRIGTRTYRLDRASLKTVHQAGQDVLDPEHLAFVRDLAPRLAHADPRLRAAAAAGLRALGTNARPYVEAVAAASEDLQVKQALLALDLRPGSGDDAAWSRAAWTRRFIDGQVTWAKENVKLTGAQEPGLRKALEAFFQSLRSGTDRAKAVEAFFTSLEGTLDAEQIKGLREEWKQFGSGR